MSSEPAQAGMLAQMADVRQRFMADLGRQVPVIRDILLEIENGQVSGETLETLQNLAHRLAGSGATLGFPEISTAARLVENAIDPTLKAEDLVPLLHAFSEVCSAASRPDFAPAARKL